MLRTIGHSTTTLDELVAMLRAFDISVLADIRTIPRSGITLSSTWMRFDRLFARDGFATCTSRSSEVCAGRARTHPTPRGRRPVCAVFNPRCRSRSGSDRTKVLTLGNGGFVLFYKRLEQPRFRLPAFREGALGARLQSSRLAMLLDGIDLSRVRTGPSSGSPRTYLPRPTRAWISTASWHQAPKSTTLRGGTKPSGSQRSSLGSGPRGSNELFSDSVGLRRTA
jgi:hypothetical protein